MVLSSPVACYFLTVALALCAPVRGSYYTDLGVSPRATKREISKAFRRQAMASHPDRMVGKSKEERDVAQERFIEINNAHETLSDERQRKKYDHELRYGAAAAQQQQQQRQRQQQRPSGFYYQNGQYYFQQGSGQQQRQQHFNYQRRQRQQQQQRSFEIDFGPLQMLVAMVMVAVPFLFLFALPRLLSLASGDDDPRDAAAAAGRRRRANQGSRARAAARPSQSSAAPRPRPAAKRKPPPPPRGPPRLPLPRAELSALRAKELKARLRYYGVDCSAAVEKADYVELLVMAQETASKAL